MLRALIRRSLRILASAIARVALAGEPPANLRTALTCSTEHGTMCEASKLALQVVSPTVINICLSTQNLSKDSFGVEMPVSNT